MSKGKVTSPGVASKAAKVLRDPNATPAEKSAAGSALSQKPGKPGGKKR